MKRRPQNDCFVGYRHMSVCQWWRTESLGMCLWADASLLECTSKDRKLRCLRSSVLWYKYSGLCKRLSVPLPHSAVTDNLQLTCLDSSVSYWFESQQLELGMMRVERERSGGVGCTERERERERESVCVCVCFTAAAWVSQAEEWPLLTASNEIRRIR